MKYNKSTKFANTMGVIYLFLIIFVVINLVLTSISETKYVGFIATTIYPYLILLVTLLGFVIVPISLIIYFVFLLIDKKENKKNINEKENNIEHQNNIEEQKSNIIKNIFLKAIFFITSLGYFIAIIFTVSDPFSNTHKQELLFNAKVKSVNYEKKYIELQYELPKFADTKNFSNEQNKPIYIKLKTDKNNIVKATEQTREEPKNGLYVIGWTTECNLNDCSYVCKDNACKYTCKQAPINDNCRIIDYRNLQRYYVKNGSLEQAKKDIENGGLIKINLLKNGFVFEKSIVRK